MAIVRTAFGQLRHGPPLGHVCTFFPRTVGLGHQSSSHHQLTKVYCDLQTNCRVHLHFVSLHMNSNDRTLWGVLCYHARQTPHHDFLVEDKDVVLSYADAFALASILLPTRIRSLHPSLGTQGSNQCVVLLSHNNTLCPLLIFACWCLSISVVPVSPSTDPSLWPAIVDLVGPSIIVTSSEFLIPMASQVQKNGGGPEVLDITSLIPSEHLIVSVPVTFRSDYIPSCQSWIRRSGHEFSDGIANPPPIEQTQQAITLFTSSAIDRETLKCVTYTHAMLFESSERAMLMLGGSVYSSLPKRHLGWLPLSHCFEFCVIFWCVSGSSALDK